MIEVSETAAQVLERINNHYTVFTNRLHHQLHQVLGKRYATAGISAIRIHFFMVCLLRSFAFFAASFRDKEIPVEVFMATGSYTHVLSA